MANIATSNFYPSKMDFKEFFFLQKDLESFLENPKNKEKRRRNLAHFFWQKLFYKTTLFDFFSKDSIETLLNSKKMAQILYEKELNEDVILLNLCVTSLSHLLKQHGLSKKKIVKAYLSRKKYRNLSKQMLISLENNLLTFISFSILKKSAQKLFSFILYFPKILYQNLNKIFFPIFSKVFYYLNSLKLFKLLFKLFFFKRPLRNIQFSFKCLNFFEKLMQIAEEKYKTPVISQSLLALVLLDSKFGKTIKSSLVNMVDFYEIKYALIKELYQEELYLKEEIKKNRQYFSYLLKATLSEQEFKKIILKEDLLVFGDLNLKTYAVRDFLIKKIIKSKSINRIEKEIFQSAFISSFDRAYGHVS